jgi:type IV secretory pathway VirB9-like protein
MGRTASMKALTAASMTLAVALGACSTQQKPPALPPPKLAADTPAESSSTSPPATGAQLLAQEPAEVQAAIKQHHHNGKYPVYRSDDYARYPYNHKPEPVVACAPLRTTDLELQAGETITDVALGDSERWMATPAASGDPRNPIPHLALKPQLAGIETNLTIYTTRHIYHLLLQSRAHAMQEVEFYYPDELLAAMKDADAKAKAATDRPTDSDDMVKLAAAMKSSTAPALLINADGGTQMVNYRVKGDYYVVDRLFSDAILVSGVGREQDRVTISYVGGSR